MSTPQQQAPKASRRSGRKTKGQSTPNGAQRAVMSDNEASRNHDQASGNERAAAHQGRRRSVAQNKAHNSGNVSDNPQSTRTQATPIKQAYAGPTFHQSPAASALPIPSFYSRSVPAQAPNPIAEDPAESADVSPPGEGTPTKRESTPLDFLFDAARQARGTPRGESPAARSGNQSIPSRSPAGRSPAPRDDSMFPFELDGGSTPGEEGTPPLSTYKDRIASVKSARTTPDVALEEHERKAKSDALKKLLMSQSPQKSPQALDPNNPFNARAPQPRPRSGPNTPSSNSIQGGQPNQYFPNTNDNTGKHYMLNNMPARPPSHLRYEAASDPEPAELSSDSAISPPRISTARRAANHTAPEQQNPYPQYAGPPPGVQPRQYPPMFNPYHGGPPPVPTNAPNPPGHRSKPSAQQLEDDLRRVLNLNVASNG